MQITSTIEFMCQLCGKPVGTNLNPEYDEIRKVYYVRVLPCSCKEQLPSPMRDEPEDEYCKYKIKCVFADRCTAKCDMIIELQKGCEIQLTD